MVLPISSTTVSEGMPRGPGATAATAADAFLLLLAALLGLDESQPPAVSPASGATGPVSEPSTEAPNDKPTKGSQSEGALRAGLALAGTFQGLVPVGTPQPLEEGATLLAPSGEAEPVSVHASGGMPQKAQHLVQGLTSDTSPAPAVEAQRQLTGFPGSQVSLDPVRFASAAERGTEAGTSTVGSLAVDVGKAGHSVPQSSGVVTNARGVRTPPPAHLPLQELAAVSPATEVAPDPSRIGEVQAVASLAGEPGVVTLAARAARDVEPADRREQVDEAVVGPVAAGPERSALARLEQPRMVAAGADVAAQVQEGLRRALERGARQIRVRLEPPDLGVVDIRVREIGGRLEVTLAASRPDVHRALEAGREGLWTALAASGFTVQRVEVQPGFAASGHGLLGGGQSGTGWSAGQQGFASDTGSGRWTDALATERPTKGDETDWSDRYDASSLVDTRV